MPPRKVPPRRAITPALYGIADWASERVIGEEWDDLIRPILLEEPEIYKLVFDVVAFLRSQGFINKKSGFRVIREIMKIMFLKGICLFQERITGTLLRTEI